MFSVVRKVVSKIRKNDFAYLDSLVGKEGGFEKQYPSGVGISSHFDGIARPKWTYTDWSLSKPKAHSVRLQKPPADFNLIALLDEFSGEAGRIATIDCCVEFQPPVIAPASTSMVLGFQNITNVSLEIFFPSFVDVTEGFNLQQATIHQISESFHDISVVDVTEWFNSQQATIHQIYEPFHDISNITDYHSNLSFPDIVDETDLLNKNPAILSIPLLLRSRKFAGKIFITKPKREPITHEKKQTEVSKHQKSEQRADGQRIIPTPDIFDLIFPVLQPPLGEVFHNPLLFPAPLYPFQVVGVKFLIEHSAALLGDEMGLGKTVQAITACRSLFRQGKIKTACVICPKAVLSNWERELGKWSPELRVVKLEGNKQKREVLWMAPAHVYVCTYETLRGDFEAVSDKRTLKDKNHFDLMIFDEIQKTKNPKASITKAVMDIKADIRWGMSGTPLENSINDLKTICEILEPKIFKNITPWYYTPQQIKNACQPIFLRRRARDVLDDLPEKVTNEIWLDLAPEQRRKYDLAEKNGIIGLKELGEAVTVKHVIALIQELKLICNYEMDSDESAKLEYLKEELEELVAEDNKALIFSQYPNKTLKKIIIKLKEFNPTEIYHGGLSDSARTQIIDNFQDNNENKIMLLSLKAGNAGITLTRANYVYHFDLWWNPAVTAQATGRALRIGQKKVVFERFLLTKGTIEERIYQIVRDKKQLFNQVIDDLSEDIDIEGTRNLTEEEIFGLFGLKYQKKQTAKPVMRTTKYWKPIQDWRKNS